jgi:hypothetical protein
LSLFIIAEKAAEPTKWADVRESEENGDFLDEFDEDELVDVVRQQYTSLFTIFPNFQGFFSMFNTSKLTCIFFNSSNPFLSVM